MLPTDKIYKMVSLNEYNEAKKTTINKLAFNYAGKTDEEKWDLIHTKLLRLVPQSEFTTRTTVRKPDGTAVKNPDGSNEENPSKWEKFQSDRKTGDANLFNISLHDCLDYFENFYFLYTTEEEKFKLNTAQKAKLLEGIQDAMGMCETGISTRFEMVLQLYRTDLDWVTNCLSKQRYELLHRLHDKYNAENNTLNSVHIHILRIMMQEAEAANLGLKVEHSIHDIFNNLRNFNHAHIRQYFRKHAPLLFKNDYEANVLDTLSQHLLFEINEIYQPLNGGDWARQGRTLEGEDITAFNKFIDDRLGFIGAGAELGEFNEDYTEFTLKPKAEFFKLLTGFVEQKLTREGHCIPFHKLTRKFESELQGLRLKQGVTLSALIEVNEAILTCNAEHMKTCRAALMKHTQVLLQYPELLLSRIKKDDMSLLLSLPKVLISDAYFLEHAVARLDILLTEAIQVGDSQHQVHLTKQLLRLVKHDRTYLKQCSESVRKLHAVKAVFAPFISQEDLRNKYEAKRNQVPVDLENLTNLSLIISGSLYSPVSEKQEAEFYKVEAIAALTKNTHVGFSQTARFAQALTPNVLIKIIEYRKKNNLPALAYCNDVSGLERFQAELLTQNIKGWTKNGLNAIKKQASDHVRLGYDKPLYGADSAAKSLTKTDFWFVAMARHQHAHSGGFKSFNQVWRSLAHNMKLMADVLMRIAEMLATLMAGIVMFVLLFALINSIPPVIYWSICLLSIFGVYLAQQANDRFLSQVLLVSSLISSFILMAPYIALAVALYSNYTQYLELEPVANVFFDASHVFFVRMYEVFFPGTSTHTPQQTDDEQAQCDETVADIAVTDENTSQEKIDALMTLQDKMAADKASGTHAAKRYAFFDCRGRERELSFNDVVRMAPEDDMSFSPI